MDIYHLNLINFIVVYLRFNANKKTNKNTYFNLTFLGLAGNYLRKSFSKTAMVQRTFFGGVPFSAANQRTQAFKVKQVCFFA